MNWKKGAIIVGTTIAALAALKYVVDKGSEKRTKGLRVSITNVDEGEVEIVRDILNINAQVVFESYYRYLKDDAVTSGINIDCEYGDIVNDPNFKMFLPTTPSEYAKLPEEFFGENVLTTTILSAKAGDESGQLQTRKVSFSKQMFEEICREYGIDCEGKRVYSEIPTKDDPDGILNVIAAVNARPRYDMIIKKQPVKMEYPGSKTIVAAPFDIGIERY